MFVIPSHYNWKALPCVDSPSIMNYNWSHVSYVKLYHALNWPFHQWSLSISIPPLAFAYEWSLSISILN